MKWGILGAAKFAREHMGPAIHAARGAELYGVATSQPSKAEPFQAFAPKTKIYSDYEALLADPEIDAVYVPLPNHLHVEWSLKALAAGKHVLCEKPVAMTAGAVDALIEARAQSGKFATEAYMIVHHPQWQRAKEIYASGALGALSHVEGIFAYNNAQDVQNIRNLPGIGGGGILDIGVYTYGATRWLTGQEPQSITHADVDFENGVDIRARVSARFEGFTAHWMNSMRMHNVQEMTFIGTEAVLKLKTPFNSNVHDQAELCLSQGMTRTIERFPGVNQYVRQVEAFVAHVEQGAAYPWHLEDAKGTLAVIDAVFAKAR